MPGVSSTRTREGAALTKIDATARVTPGRSPTRARCLVVPLPAGRYSSEPNLLEAFDLRLLPAPERWPVEALVLAAFARALMMVDLPTLGTPVIIAKQPVVLNLPAASN